MKPLAGMSEVFLCHKTAYAVPVIFGGNMRIWGKLWRDNHLLMDVTIEENSDDTRTHHIMDALDQITMEFDLSKPIWLDVNIKEFKKSAKTRFRKDSFIEEIEFDYLEIEVLEE